MLENEVSYRYAGHFFTCMPKGLHAPRRRIWFQGRLFPPNKTYILKGRGLPLSGYQKVYFFASEVTIDSALSIGTDNVYRQALT